MRGSGNPLGVFDQDFEFGDIEEGIGYDLTSFVGTSCLWYVWSTGSTHPTYDVGNATGTGRQWLPPITIPVTRNLLSRGTGTDSGKGYYIVDTLHLTINGADILPKIPTIIPFPNVHTKDRIIYDGAVYTCVNVQPRGVLQKRYAVLTVDMQEVMPDEMVNDPQFQAYA